MMPRQRFLQNMERDEKKITGEKFIATSQARGSMKRLVKLGATPNEISETIEQIAKQAKDEAVLCFAQKVA